MLVRGNAIEGKSCHPRFSDTDALTAAAPTGDRCGVAVTSRRRPDVSRPREVILRYLFTRPLSPTYITNPVGEILGGGRRKFLLARNGWDAHLAAERLYFRAGRHQQLLAAERSADSIAERP